ncbi:hypothetical protein [Paraburkholderia tropica]|nr:hypothetical protein [Paraburkholderia tropica]
MSYGSALAAVLIPAVLLVPLFALSPAARAQSAANADVVPATTAATLGTNDAAIMPATLKAEPLTVDNGQIPSQDPNGSAPLAADPGQAGEHSSDSDNGILAGVGMLDDQTLSRQRGGAVGMVMVAATPQLMRGASVTLWDEIAPPTPIPIPVDSSQAAQGNIASYFRR